MDATLAINPGSASKKYALFNGERVVLTVLFEHVGDGYGKCVEIDGTRQQCEDVTASVYGESLKEVLAIAERNGVIASAQEITRVGIRIVAPGTFFTAHRIIDDAYIGRLEKMERAAPLHLAHTLAEIRTAQEVLAHAKIVGASDSAFHSTIPPHVSTYSIPRTDTESFDTRRFGYHGLSVSSAVRQSTRILGDFPPRAIVCHVGSGVSVTALNGGKSFDTTMGFNPASGLMMNSRVGDIDPGALLHLMREKELSLDEAEKYINESGGFKGMLGQGDLRIALDRAARADGEASLAVDMYMYRIRKAIGSFVAVLGGLDVLILTATAPERNPAVRARICEGLAGVGITIDHDANESLTGRPGSIGAETSTAKILVVHTNEMYEINEIAQSL